MKELLILIMIIAIGALWMDDHSKRADLEQQQTQVQSITAELGQLRVQIVQPNGNAAPPNWFQQRLNEQTRLNPLRRQY